MRRFVVCLLAALALAGLLATPAEACERDCQARSFIEAFGSNMVSVIKASQIDLEERQRRLRALLVDTVDVDGMERFVLGEHWSQTTPEQRQEFKTLFTNYAMDLFSRNLLRKGVDDFIVVGVDDFIVVGEDDLAGSQALVHTRIERRKGESQKWSWKVQQSQDRFQIVDLIVDGVSLASTYRSEIGSTVSMLGMDALLRILWVKS